jgi:YHS domain-containing protein
MDHEAALAPSGPSTHTHDHVVPAEGGALDPVCGMTVDTHTAKHRADYRGQPYYFCSAGCKTKFTADPQKYLSKEEKTVEPVAEGTIYTCPMHPIATAPPAAPASIPIVARCSCIIKYPQPKARDPAKYAKVSFLQK